MKDYSSERFTCRFCGKQMRGYVPRMGDGTGFLLPRHSNKSGARCKGTGTMFDAGDGERLKSNE